MLWYKFRTGTKLILSTLFILQIFIIGIYWLFQQGLNLDTKNISINNKNDKIQSNVNFIQKIKNKITQQQQNDNLSLELNNIENINYKKFHNDKIILKSSSNFTIDFITYFNNDKNLTCFRQGTIINLSNIIDNNINIQKNIKQKNVQECECQSEWHGKDCGQPEIIWRALMTSKVPIIQKSRQSILLPHKIILMITGNFINLELLEIQLFELEKSVDFFILCCCQHQQQQNQKFNSYNIFKNQLKMKLPKELFDRILIINNKNLLILKNQTNHNNNCIPKLIYKQFKLQLNNNSKFVLNSDDIFIYCLDDEILNKRAVKYFKYYNDIPKRGVIRFRLKYNVYGFYWQHPESTRLGSALCTIQQLEDNLKSDPERMLNIKKPIMIIGDLNHIGGWYCRYCYQPNQIIDKLTIESTAKIIENKIDLPKIAIQNGKMDISYIQNLIASGLFVDGKLGLNKLHRFSDKYYAPDFVEQNAWKFDNILINLFLSFNPDDDNDEYGN